MGVSQKASHYENVNAVRLRPLVIGHLTQCGALPLSEGQSVFRVVLIKCELRCVFPGPWCGRGHITACSTPAVCISPHRSLGSPRTLSLDRGRVAPLGHRTSKRDIKVVQPELSGEITRQKQEANKFNRNDILKYCFIQKNYLFYFSFFEMLMI